MSIFNPSIFQGEQSFGTTPGAPLSTDANNQVISGISAIEVSDTATATTSSGTDAVMTTMTITPTPGTYLALFSCDINSPTAGAAISVSFYLAGTQISTTLRKIIPFAGGTLTSGSARAAVSLNKIVTVGTGQTIDVRWSTSAGTVTAASRDFQLVRLS